MYSKCLQSNSATETVIVKSRTKIGSGENVSFSWPRHVEDKKATTGWGTRVFLWLEASIDTSTMAWKPTKPDLECLNVGTLASHHMNSILSFHCEWRSLFFYRGDHRKRQILVWGPEDTNRLRSSRIKKLRQSKKELWRKKTGHSCKQGASAAMPQQAMEEPVCPGYPVEDCLVL